MSAFVRHVSRTALLGVLMVALAARASAAPERVFVYHLNGDPGNLDPAKSANQRSLPVMWLLYERLIDLSRDARVFVPGLATSWHVSTDGLRYTLHLRRGVTFHDGTPFNAEAVKANIERNYLPTSEFYTPCPRNAREGFLKGLIRGIRAKDDYTLVVELTKPRHDFLGRLYLLSMASPSGFRRAKEEYARAQGERAKVQDPECTGEHVKAPELLATAQQIEANALQPVGTGPFKFAGRSTPGIELRANANYWHGAPKLDGVFFRVGPLSDRMIDAFLEGRVHFLPDVEAAYLERIRSGAGRQNARLERVHTPNMFYLGFATEKAPFDSLRVRQAFARAINVADDVATVFQDLADPLYSVIQPEAKAFDRAGDTARRKGQFNKRVATEPWKEAHVAGPLEIRLGYTAAALPSIEHLVKFIAADLTRNLLAHSPGITVTPVAFRDYRALLAAVQQKGVGLFIYNWVFPFTDPDDWLGRLFESGGVNNLTQYSNPEVDALLGRARNEVNETRRSEIYRRAETLVLDAVPLMPLFRQVRVSAWNADVGGLKLNAFSWPVDRLRGVELLSR